MKNRPAWPWLLFGGALACARPGIGPRVYKPGSLVPATATVYGELDLAAIAQSGMLQEELVAKLRDRLLRRFGVQAEDARRSSGIALVFALPGGSAAAFLPGLALDGPPARNHHGVQLRSRGDHVSAHVRGGTLVGDSTAVVASLDVLHRGARAFADSALPGLLAQGTALKTIRFATTEPTQLLGVLPTRPPANLMARLTGAAAFANLDGMRLYALIVVTARDADAGRDLAAWAERERSGFRAQLSSWRANAGIFGSALDPAIQALDGITVEANGAQVRAVAQLDLGPIFSSGLLTVLKTLQVFSP